MPVLPLIYYIVHNLNRYMKNFTVWVGLFGYIYFPRDIIKAPPPKTEASQGEQLDVSQIAHLD